MKHSIIFLLLFAIYSHTLFSQKVGLVLSGGGASGMAYVGVLKALEEENIPIDYIVGTSIGALIGGFYAAGYTASEIEEIVVSDEFRSAANGIIDQQHEFYFKKSPSNAGMLNIDFRLDSLFESNIPTNFVNSTPIDLGLLQYFIPANAIAKENFDSLLIPFRCLSANITKGKEEVLSSGNLASAIRASMTYPFYLPPISINGNLMFDGGLYNNFPADVMCTEFDVDYIIASNVSTKLPPPQANNLLSQLRNILIKESTYKIKCTEGVIINSNVEGISTFDFYQNKKTIERGYESALPYIDTIKDRIYYIENEMFREKREAFNRKKPPIKFNKITFDGLHPNQEKYLAQNLKRNNYFSYNELRSETMKFASDEGIESIHPTVRWNDSTKEYDINLKVNKKKPFQLSFGGVISSKPFSTGFVELEYRTLKATSLKLHGNIYFGTFYSSVEGGVRWDIPFDIPFYLEGKYTNNQFDYFDDRRTFIDNKDQSYIVNGEQYWEGKIGLPFLTKGLINLGASYFQQDYNYYQTTSFNRGDTADLTKFEGHSTFAKYSRNSLNRKMYASKGSKYEIMLRYIDGKENTYPGSTARIKDDSKKAQNWFILKGGFDKYFLNSHKFRLGISAEGAYSNQPFFQNYTATVLSAPAYEPIPLSKTLFQDEFRALTDLGAGLKLIYSIRETVDLRAEVFIFQPYETIYSGEKGEAMLSDEIKDQRYLGSFSAVYHTPLGPLSASINYFSDFDTEFSFLFHFGYILFNKKAFQ